MKNLTLTTVLFFTALISQSIAQDNLSEEELPYKEIGEYPDDYNSGNVVKRLIDGLGYRYYWATETLTEEDLSFKPGETNRTSTETLDHLHGLSKMILNTALGKANERGNNQEELTWLETRKSTLHNFKEAADAFANQNPEFVKNQEIIFKRGENNSTVSFWHLINGPIADALNHVGQIVSNRRASGNPIDPRVNVFMGKTRLD